MSAHAASRGFTLIELMVAIMIAALLLLIGMPSFTTFLRNSEIRSTAESLINGLRTAEAEAARQNAKVAFSLAGGTGPGWAINLSNNDDCTDLVQPPIQQYAKKEAGSRASVVLTGAPLVCFNGLGRIRNQGVSPSDHLQQIDIASSVVGEARALRIIVDDPAPPAPGKPRGLRMCDPDPAIAALVPPDPRAC